MEEAPLSLKPELVSEESMGLDTPSSERTPEELSPSSDDYEVRDVVLSLEKKVDHKERNLVTYWDFSLTTSLILFVLLSS